MGGSSGMFRLSTATSRSGRRMAVVTGAVLIGVGAVTATPVAAQELVAAYPLDETAGIVVNDRSGNGRHATIVNANANTVFNGGRGLTLPGGNGGTAPAVQL